MEIMIGKFAILNWQTRYTPDRSCSESDRYSRLFWMHYQNMKVLLINRQFKYMSTKFRIELSSRLKLVTVLKFWHSELRNYFQVKKEGYSKTKLCECGVTKNYWSGTSSL